MEEEENIEMLEVEAKRQENTARGEDKSEKLRHLRNTAVNVIKPSAPRGNKERRKGFPSSVGNRKKNYLNC